jgi:adenylate kinase
MRMEETFSEFEVAFERESALERRRRQQLRQRAAARSRARKITDRQQRGKVAFGVLAIALTATVVVVVFAMFETLAWLMG